MTDRDQSMADPMSRDPREYGFGLFVTDAPQFGGVQGFMWFATEAEALAYLRTELADVYYPDSEEDANALRSTIEHCLEGVTELQSLPCAELSSVQGEFELEWAGTFEQLASGSGDFSRGIQIDFRDEHPSGEIVDDEYDEFVEFLASYAG